MRDKFIELDWPNVAGTFRHLVGMTEKCAVQQFYRFVDNMDIHKFKRIKCNFTMTNLHLFHLCFSFINASKLSRRKS